MQMARRLYLPKMLRQVEHPLKNRPLFLCRVCRHHISPTSGTLMYPSPRVVLGRLSGGDTHTRNQRRPTPAATGYWQ